MATFGNGTIVNTAVFAQAASNGSTASYTCPASCYAIVNIGSDSATGTVLVNIGVLNIANLSNGGGSNSNIFYVGPGQTITANIGSHKATISGVEFINSN